MYIYIYYVNFSVHGPLILYSMSYIVVHIALLNS